MENKVIDSGNQAKLYNLLSRRVKRNNRIPSPVSDNGERELNENDTADRWPLPQNLFSHCWTVPRQYVCKFFWISCYGWFHLVYQLSNAEDFYQVQQQPPSLTLITQVLLLSRKRHRTLLFPLELIYNYSLVHADVPARWGMLTSFLFPNPQLHIIPLILGQ